MPSRIKHPTPPPTTSGFRLFVRSSYTSKYNFAVENYNAVSTTGKKYMRDFFVLLYRSVVVVVWIITMVFAVLAKFTFIFFVPALILSIIYVALSFYNGYVFFDNKNLLNSTRLLRAKTAGPDGLDYEWVLVPIDSPSANERLAAVEQSTIDNVRREFAGSGKSEIECMVYTNRYANTYPSLPKELFIYMFGFVLSGLFSFVMYFNIV